jgi:hypothetical protein
MMKYNLRLQWQSSEFATMAGQVADATLLRLWQTPTQPMHRLWLQAAGNADRFHPAAHPKYGTRRKTRM